MPKVAKELTAAEVARRTEPGMHAVGGVTGLYLNVKPTGARSWILRVKIGGSRADIGLGGYPSVRLAEARDKAREKRRQIEEGLDPREVRREARDKLRAEQHRSRTFDEAAKESHSIKAKEFKNRKHAAQWIATLETYASPVIGRMRVDRIDVPDILEVLQPIWETKTETATRVRQRVETVLTHATVSKYRTGDNPARWKGNLSELLPKPSKVAKVQHHRSLPFRDAPVFMATLRRREGMAARALEFLILTAARSGEVRLATWDEIDLDAKLWTIPAERMKADRKHCVPLTSTAVRLLKALPRFEGSPYIFPAPRGGALSDAALPALLRRMKVDAVPHGFRSTFKDWCRNDTSYADEVSELALAHVDSDATRAAYARDELLPKRTRLMRVWADYLDNPVRHADVTSIRDAK